MEDLTDQYRLEKIGSDSGWWFGTFGLFFHILGIMIPTDELIFFRGVGIPPTRIGLDSCLKMRKQYGKPENHARKKRDNNRHGSWEKSIKLSYFVRTDHARYPLAITTEVL